jgi:hypothetical protein
MKTAGLCKIIKKHAMQWSPTFKESTFLREVLPILINNDKKRSGGYPHASNRFLLLASRVDSTAVLHLSINTAAKKQESQLSTIPAGDLETTLKVSETWYSNLFEDEHGQ